MSNKVLISIVWVVCVVVVASAVYVLSDVWHWLAHRGKRETLN